MKKSILFSLITICLIFFGCEKNNPQNLILGKWYVVSFGTTENDLCDDMYYDGVYDEFKSDGTIWRNCYACLLFEYPQYPYYYIGSYKIDKEYFYRYDLFENEEIYSYSFDGDKLKISNIDPKLIEYPYRFDANIFLYERVKN